MTSSYSSSEKMATNRSDVQRALSAMQNKAGVLSKLGTTASAKQENVFDRLMSLVTENENDAETTKTRDYHRDVSATDQTSSSDASAQTDVNPFADVSSDDALRLQSLLTQAQDFYASDSPTSTSAMREAQSQEEAASAGDDTQQAPEKTDVVSSGVDVGSALLLLLQQMPASVQKDALVVTQTDASQGVDQAAVSSVSGDDGKGTGALFASLLSQKTDEAEVKIDVVSQGTQNDSDATTSKISLPQDLIDASKIASSDKTDALAQAALATAVKAPVVATEAQKNNVVPVVPSDVDKGVVAQSKGAVDLKEASKVDQTSTKDAILTQVLSDKLVNDFVAETTLLSAESAPDLVSVTTKQTSLKAQDTSVATDPLLFETQQAVQSSVTTKGVDDQDVQAKAALVLQSASVSVKDVVVPQQVETSQAATVQAVATQSTPKTKTKESSIEKSVDTSKDVDLGMEDVEATRFSSSKEGGQTKTVAAVLAKETPTQEVRVSDAGSQNQLGVMAPSLKEKAKESVEAQGDTMVAVGGQAVLGDLDIGTSVKSESLPLSKSSQEIAGAPQGEEAVPVNVNGVTPVVVSTVAVAATQNVKTEGGAAQEGGSTLSDALLAEKPIQQVDAENLVVSTEAEKTTAQKFATQLAAKLGTTDNSRATSVVEQVSAHILRQVKGGADEISLQLHPSELGRVDIKLTISDDHKVQATIMADNQSTLDLLKQDSSQLQQALQDAGLQSDAGTMQFSLRDDKGGNTFAQQEQARLAAADNDVPHESDEKTRDTTIIETDLVQPGRVNIKV